MTQGFQQQHQDFGPGFKSALKPQQKGSQIAPASKTPIFREHPKTERKTFAEY